MGIVNKSIPRIYKDDLGNIKVEHSPIPEEVSIDDAFDPLFNAKAREYLTNKYGNAFLGTLGGYAEMWENALAPKENKWGKLGPAMGILGTFGRTIDKAEDFILGGLTEGVNALNYVNPLATREVKPSNPLRNIFVNDEDYSGQRLFAAMANSMSKLAGGTTLNENDFQGTWAIPSIEAELMTDPGILGGAVAKAYSPTAKAMSSSDILQRLRTSPSIDGTTLGDVSQLLSNYDDLLAKGAWDITLPGVRPLVGNILNRIKRLVGHSDIGEYVDAELTGNAFDDSSKQLSSPPSSQFTEGIPYTKASFKTYGSKYTKRVGRAIDSLKTVDINNANDKYFNDIVDYLTKVDPKIVQDPEFAESIANIKATLKARDILTNGGNINTNSLQKAYDSYNKAMAQLDEIPKNLQDQLDALIKEQQVPYAEGTDYRKFYKKRQNLDAQIADVRKQLEVFDNPNDAALQDRLGITKAKQDFQDQLDKFYYLNSNAFESKADAVRKFLKFKKENLDKSFIKRSALYNDELNSIINEFRKTMPNAPVDFHKANEKVETILSDKKTLDRVKEEFTSHYVDVAKGEHVAKGAVPDVGGETDFYSWMGDATEYTDDDVKSYILNVLEGNVGEYPENVIHKYNLEKFLGLISPSAKPDLSPVYFSFSTREWKRIPTETALDYVKSRLKQAVLESPTLWSSKSASEYFDNLRKDPKVLKALEGLNYVDKSGKVHDMADHFRHVLASIINESYVVTKGKYKGSVRTIDDLTKLLNYYDELSNTVIKMVEDNPNLGLDYTTLRPLIEWAEDVRTDVFNNLYIRGQFWKDAIKMDEAFPYNKELNKYLYANPTFFTFNYKTNRYLPEQTGKYLDMDRLAEYTKLAPHFEVQLDKNAFKDGKLGMLINGEFIPGSDLKKLFSGKNGEVNFKKFLNTIRFNKDTANVKQKLNKMFTIENTVNNMRVQSMDKLSKSFKENIDKLIADVDNKFVIPNTFDSDSLFIKDFYDDVNATVIAENIELPDNVFKLPEGAPLDPKQYLSKKGVMLFDVLNEMKSIRAKNAMGDLASLRNKQYLELVDRATKIVKTMNTEELDKFFALRDLMTDDVIKGNSLYNDLLESGGFAIGAFNKTSPINEFDGARKAIEHNIKTTTIKLKDGTVLPLFKIIEFEDDNAKYLGLRWNVEQGKLIDKNRNLFKFDELQDIVFHKGISNERMTQEMAKYKDLNEVFAQAQNISGDMLKTLGVSDNLFNTYTHHALIMGEGNVKRVGWLEDTIYSKLPADDLDLLNASLLKKSKIKGTFGVTPITRSLRGNISDWNASANVFSTNPLYVLKSQFSNGIYANQDVQTYTDMFVNDNFKLSTYKLDKNRLKDILNLKDSHGRLGNLNNLELVAPVFDKETGQLKKFKRFDKLSDEGIELALKNPDTILVPTWSIAPLDKMLRKDAKMSNKFYAFANKYLINPFKFGTLINPGFLIGNVNDAYLKQATTMSQKYGTSMAEELENVAISIRQVMQINNTFADDVWEMYLKDTAQDIEKYPYLKIMSTMPESNMSRKHFEDWFNAKRPILTDKQINTINLWMYLNSAQATSAFRDIESLKDVQKLNKFDTDDNLLETILRKMTVDNKIGEKVFGANETTETIFRSSAVLNDLTHKYSIDDIERILGNVYERDEAYQKIPGEFGFKNTKEYKKLQINIQNAINAMNNANFDYNNMPDFMDFMSTFIPFPTFYLKNMCYWVDVAVNNPEYIDTAITIQDSAWHSRNKDVKTDKFSAEAKGRGAIPLDSITNIEQISSKLPNPLSSITPQFKGIVKPTPLNSLFGAFNSLNNPIKDLGQRVHPALSPITHHLLDDEDVKYRPYSSNPYEKNIKKGDPNFSMLKYTFHRLNPYERAINTGLRTPNKLKEGTAQLYDFMPSVFQPDFSKKSASNKK